MSKTNYKKEEKEITSFLKRNKVSRFYMNKMNNILDKSPYNLGLENVRVLYAMALLERKISKKDMEETLKFLFFNNNRFN